ncbi:hypothetical protein B0T19DRAFT_425204 [Cercophora scortea]|uniref:BTB domain-containing protein n=1 Tax=Cercophora scortea TaxID=314031 RepID=A0AAE0IDC9_9PEZI|nr:hypothetical protein B0T19DRAFT_425204 [Cercophora scortea]
MCCPRTREFMAVKPHRDAISEVNDWATRVLNHQHGHQASMQRDCPTNNRSPTGELHSERLNNIMTKRPNGGNNCRPVQFRAMHYYHSNSTIPSMGAAPSALPRDNIAPNDPEEKESRAIALITTGALNTCSSSTDHRDELKMDASFDISPFSSPFISLQFATGFPLSIHRAFFLKSSKLALLCDPSTKELDLQHISGNTGHVLVQYFYTGKYEALEWTGPQSGPSAHLAEFRTSFEVYSAARTYELDGLEELAKEQIVQLGQGLDAFTMIDVVKEAYPVPVGDDVWFPNYMKGRIKAAFEDPTAIIEADFPSNYGDNFSIAKVLFRGMLEVYCEMLESLSQDTSDVEPFTPLTDESAIEGDRDEGVSLPLRDKSSFDEVPVVECVPANAGGDFSYEDSSPLLSPEPDNPIETQMDGPFDLFDLFPRDEIQEPPVPGFERAPMSHSDREFHSEPDIETHFDAEAKPHLEAQNASQVKARQHRGPEPLPEVQPISPTMISSAAYEFAPEFVCASPLEAVDAAVRLEEPGRISDSDFEMAGSRTYRSGGRKRKETHSPNEPLTPTFGSWSSTRTVSPDQKPHAFTTTNHGTTKAPIIHKGKTKATTQVEPDPSVCNFVPPHPDPAVHVAYQSPVLTPETCQGSEEMADEQPVLVREENAVESEPTPHPSPTFNPQLSTVDGSEPMFATASSPMERGRGRGSRLSVEKEVASSLSVVELPQAGEGSTVPLVVVEVKETRTRLPVSKSTREKKKKKAIPTAADAISGVERVAEVDEPGQDPWAFWGVQKGKGKSVRMTL